MVTTCPLRAHPSTFIAKAALDAGKGTRTSARVADRFDPDPHRILRWTTPLLEPAGPKVKKEPSAKLGHSRCQTGCGPRLARIGDLRMERESSAFIDTSRTTGQAGFPFPDRRGCAVKYWRAYPAARSDARGRTVASPTQWVPLSPGQRRPAARCRKPIHAVDWTKRSVLKFALSSKPRVVR